MSKNTANETLGLRNIFQEGSFKEFTNKVEESSKDLISLYRENMLLAEYRNRIQIMIIDGFMSVNSSSISRMWLGRSAEERHENLSKVAHVIGFVTCAPFSFNINEEEKRVIYQGQKRHEVASKLLECLVNKDLAEIHAMHKEQCNFIESINQAHSDSDLF